MNVQQDDLLMVNDGGSEWALFEREAGKDIVAFFRASTIFMERNFICLAAGLTVLRDLEK